MLTKNSITGTVIKLEGDSKSNLWKHKMTSNIYVGDNIRRDQNWLQNVHLYIVSDEEIVEGDIVIRPDNKILKIQGDEYLAYIESESNATKKIIATTDTTWNLSKIPLEFLFKYSQENGEIKIVEVDLKNILYNPLTGKEISTFDTISNEDTKSKNVINVIKNTIVLNSYKK